MEGENVQQNVCQCVKQGCTQFPEIMKPPQKFQAPEVLHETSSHYEDLRVLDATLLI